MALQRVVIFCRHAFYQPKSSHQPRGPQHSRSPHAHTLCTHHSAHSQHKHLSRILKRHKAMVVITIPQPHSIHIQFEAIVYFVIHLTHITRHIEWRYTHSSPFFKCNCYANCVLLICAYSTVAAIWVGEATDFSLFCFVVVKEDRKPLLKGDLSFGNGFGFISLGKLGWHSNRFVIVVHFSQIKWKKGIGTDWSVGERSAINDKKKPTTFLRFLNNPSIKNPIFAI